MFELAPIAFITTDPFGKILDANSSASACLQVDARFLVGRPILTYVVPEHRRRLRTWMLGLTRRAARDSITARMKRRSEVTFDAEISVTASADEIWWAIVDVTAQRQAEESVWELNREIELRVAAQARELQAVYDEFPLGIAIVDAATRSVSRRNRRAREILAPWGTRIPGLDVDGADGSDLWQLDRVLDGERVWDAVMRLRAPDGEEVVEGHRDPDPR